MPAGGPGDHPLTDILLHRLPVYSPEADDLIRKISHLSSVRELNEWWEKEIAWNDTPEIALLKSKVRYDMLLKRAKDNGWEIPEENRGTR